MSGTARARCVVTRFNNEIGRMIMSAAISNRNEHNDMASICARSTDENPAAKETSTRECEI